MMRLGLILFFTSYMTIDLTAQGDAIAPARPNVGAAADDAAGCGTQGVDAVVQALEAKGDAPEAKLDAARVLKEMVTSPGGRGDDCAAAIAQTFHFPLEEVGAVGDACARSVEPSRRRSKATPVRSAPSARLVRPKGYELLA